MLIGNRVKYQLLHLLFLNLRKAFHIVVNELALKTLHNIVFQKPVYNTFRFITNMIHCPFGSLLPFTINNEILKGPVLPLLVYTVHGWWVFIVPFMKCRSKTVKEAFSQLLLSHHYFVSFLTNSFDNYIIIWSIIVIPSSKWSPLLASFLIL